MSIIRVRSRRCLVWFLNIFEKIVQNRRAGFWRACVRIAKYARPSQSHSIRRAFGFAVACFFSTSGPSLAVLCRAERPRNMPRTFEYFEYFELDN